MAKDKPTSEQGARVNTTPTFLHKAFLAAGGVYALGVGSAFAFAGTAFTYINSPLSYPLWSFTGALSLVRSTTFYSSLTSVGLVLGYKAFGKENMLHRLLAGESIDYLELLSDKNEKVPVTRTD